MPLYDTYFLVHPDGSFQTMSPERFNEAIELASKRSIPSIKKIYFNGRHTTIAWCDGEKTTVGCVEGQHFDEYNGFAAAVLKRLFGSSAKALNYMNERKEVQPAVSKKDKSKSTAEKEKSPRCEEENCL